jgi:hypothetical protein
MLAVSELLTVEVEENGGGRRRGHEHDAPVQTNFKPATAGRRSTLVVASFLFR